MGDAQKKNNFYTIEAYEAIAKNAKEGERYEYCDGEIIPFTDEYTTDDHNQIIQNTADSLKTHFYPQGCRVYTENVRLLIEDKMQYRLPDVMVTCSVKDKESKDAKREPILLAEVLSPSSAFTDLVEKVQVYQQIPSLQAYLILNSAKIWVRIYYRNMEGNWVQGSDLDSTDQIAEISSLGLHIPVSKLYSFVL